MRIKAQTAQSSPSKLVVLSIYTERTVVSLYTMTINSAGLVDRLDAVLIELLAAEPRVGVLEASRRLGVARGTVQARLDRMRDRGVITGYGPEVDPAALGYEVTAFITLEIRQAGGHDPVAEHLAAIPEVLEVHTITGAGDMLCRVVARSNADLQRVLDAIVAAEGVVRSATLISLAAQVPYRILPLVRAAASGAGRILRSQNGRPEMADLFIQEREGMYSSVTVAAQRLPVQGLESMVPGGGGDGLDGEVGRGRANGLARRCPRRRRSHACRACAACLGGRNVGRTSAAGARR